MDTVNASEWRTQALSVMGYVGVWQADLTTHKVRGDHDLGRVFGVAPGKMPDGICIDDLDHLYLAGDLDLVKRSRRAVVPAGGHIRYEFRMRDLSGDGSRWIRSLAHMEVDRDGRMREVSGALFDITARPPTAAGVYLPSTREVSAGEPGLPPLHGLDRLAGQIIQASRGARALGLDEVEADLRRTLNRVGALLSSRFRMKTSH